MGLERLLPRNLRTRFTLLALSCIGLILLAMVPPVLKMERELLFERRLDEIQGYLQAMLRQGDSDLRAIRQHAMAMADMIQQWTPSEGETLAGLLEHALHRLHDAFGIRVAFESDSRQWGDISPGLYVRRGAGTDFVHESLRYAPTDTAEPGAEWYLPLRREPIGPWIDGRWSDPFAAPETGGETVMSCAVPILSPEVQQAVFTGVVAIDVTLEPIREAMRRIDLYPEAEIYFIGADRLVTVVAIPASRADRAEEQRLAARVAAQPDAFSHFQQIQNPRIPAGWFIDRHPFSGAKSLFVFEQLPHDAAQLLHVMPRQALEADWYALSSWIAGFGLLAMLGTGLLLSWSAGLATRNLEVLRVGVRNVRAGNLRTLLPPAVARDETAEIIDAFNEMTAELDRTLRQSEQLAREGERVATELDLARRIQESSLPGPIHLPGGEIHSRMRPALEVAGDFYEHFQLPGGRVALAVGDVSGKGVSAALFAARAAQLLRSSATLLSPADALTQVNTLLSRSNPELMFVTLFFGVWDPAAEQLAFVSAGHPAPLLLHADGQVERLAQLGGPAIGPLRGRQYQAASIPFPAGALLAIYTDGLTEAPAATTGEQFGEDRLRDYLVAHRDAPLNEASSGLMEAVCVWQGGGNRFDDMTLLLARPAAPVTGQVYPADTACIESVVEAVTAGALAGGMDAMGAKKLALAACEAVTNIILHALGSDPARQFRVYLGWVGATFVVRCEDEGPAFDPDALPPVDLAAPLARRPIGGLGWVLIRDHCDEVRMERVATTNILTLARRRHPD